MNIAAKQAEEVDLAVRLLTALRRIPDVVEKRDRPDVLARIGRKTIGIEVTQFHADEGRGHKGSALRAKEEATARQVPGQTYGMWGITDPNPALISRINQKIDRGSNYNNSGLDEVWLLISGGAPRLGAIGSTHAIPAFLNLHDLNASTHASLERSVFSTAYTHLILPSALYCWSRDQGWHRMQVGA